MESCYSSQPHLLLGEDRISSCCGVHQGDPLGPLGFALTLHPIVERIKAGVPDLPLNVVWYLDDGTLVVGPPADLTTTLQIVERHAPEVGLKLNRCKSHLYIPKDTDPSLLTLPSDIPISRQGLCLLGCPVGPPDFCKEIFSSRPAKVKASLEVLPDLDDCQMEIALLRSCLSLPEVSYICPPRLPSESHTPHHRQL